jgi:hypothetical protein
MLVRGRSKHERDENPLRRTFLLMAGAALAPPLMAQERFPSKMIRIVVPFAAGGVGDALARLVSTQLATSLGSPAIVENWPVETACPAPQMPRVLPRMATPSCSSHRRRSSNMALRDKLPYDLLRDFTPAARAVVAPIILVVPSSHPAIQWRSLSPIRERRRTTLHTGPAQPGPPDTSRANCSKGPPACKPFTCPAKGQAR